MFMARLMPDVNGFGKNFAQYPVAGLIEGLKMID